MKPLINKSINLVSLVLFVLASMLWESGCETSTPDPTAGWRILFSKDYDKLDKSILEDYRAYIEALPNGESRFVGPVTFLEDGAGQHAVRIEIALDGTDWAHVIIYDKNNKRVKIIKYVSGHYRS
jgi:hypothetical protein